MAMGHLTSVLQVDRITFWYKKYVAFIVFAFVLFVIFFTWLRPEQIWNRNNSDSTSFRCTTILSAENMLLDRNTFIYNNSALLWTMVTPKQTKCYLNSYTRRDAVNCLESINRDVRRLKNFVFIGDSRARQQFFNFLKFIPDYDLNFDPQLDITLESQVDLHIDRNVTSSLLGIKVSYFWRPHLNEYWADLIQEWLEHPPSLLLINVGIHQLTNMGGNHRRLQPFQDVLIQLLPSLRRLANRTELIWMNQYPVLPMPRYLLLSGGDINSRNIHVLNKLTRQILQKSGVKVWDSGNPPVEEYVRSCGYLEWTDRIPSSQQSYRNDYFNCKDMVHPGYVALSHATQILLNHMCNRFF